MELDAKLLELILKSIDELRGDIKDLRLEIKLNNEKLNNDYVKKSEFHDYAMKEIAIYFEDKNKKLDNTVKFSENVIKIILFLSGLGAFIFALSKIVG